MSRNDLISQSVLGSELERLLENDTVQAVVREQLAARREAILGLPPQEAGRFTALKAGIDALEEFLAALAGMVELGRQARQSLAEGPGGPSGRGRVL